MKTTATISKGVIEIDVTFTPHSVAELITFENSNEIAYHLANTDPVTATALLEELLVWRETGRI